MKDDQHHGLDDKLDGEHIKPTESSDNQERVTPPNPPQFQVQFTPTNPQQFSQIPGVTAIPVSQLGQQTNQQESILPHVQSLMESINESTREGNLSESNVASQIILISSGILAVLGVVGLNMNSDDSSKLSGPAAFLLLVAVFGLGSSLIAGVAHFASERKFWYDNRSTAALALSMLGKVPDPASRNNAAEEALKNIKPTSSRVSFWIEVFSFITGIGALLILVIGKIIANIG